MSSAEAQTGQCFIGKYRLRTNLRVLPDKLESQDDISGAPCLVQNVPRDKEGRLFVDVGFLVEAATLDEAEEISSVYAEEFAYNLAFVTGVACRVQRPIFVIDWAPGKSARTLFQYGQYEHNQALSVIDETVLSSINNVDRHCDHAGVQSSLRWYGRSLRASALEERFQYAWFGLEILATIEAPSSRVPSICPRCQTVLNCTNPDCGDASHRPYQKEKIALLLESVQMRPGLIRGLAELRNRILHGDEREEVEEHMENKFPGYSLENAVEIAQRSLRKAIFQKLNFAEGEIRPMMFEDGAPKQLVGKVKAEVTIGLPGDPFNPRPEDIWLPELSVMLKDEQTGHESQIIL